MDILLSNIIVYLTRYVAIARQFFKSKYIKLGIDILKWEIMAYAFTLVGGYSATLCYMYLIVYEVMKFTQVSKVTLFDIAVYLTCVAFIYFSHKYNIIFLLPFIALFINMVLKPIFKNKLKYHIYFNMLIDLAICIYSYKYHLYVLFIFNVFKIVFPIIGGSIKNITDYANKKIR